jgi:hypothetical protein
VLKENVHATAPLLTYTLRMLPEVWFDPKQSVVRLEADRGLTRSMSARRQSLRGITALRRQENCRVAA